MKNVIFEPDKLFIGVLLLNIGSGFLCAEEEPKLEVVETDLADRSTVKTEVEVFFQLTEDASAMGSMSFSNPAANGEMHLSSFGRNVEVNLTVMTQPDEDIPPDMDIWHISTTEPQYVIGAPTVYVDATKQANLENMLTTAKVFHETVYHVNYTTDNEIAAFDERVRIVLDKTEEPVGSLLVMGILDDILEFDWNQETVKSVVNPVEE